MVAIIYRIALVLNSILDVLKLNSTDFPKSEDFKDPSSLINSDFRQAHEYE